MANSEHLEIINRGVDSWNDWREKYPNEIPNLSGAILKGVDLSGAEFSETNLLNANLSGSSLNNAVLIGANLSGADLSEAILIEANFATATLVEANLFNATLFSASLGQTNLYLSNLSEAKLCWADLSRANLHKANLCKANFFEAILHSANLSFTDLSYADLSFADLSFADISKADLFGANLSASRFICTIIDGIKISKSKVYGISVWDCTGEIVEQKDLVITPHGQPEVTVDNIKIAQFIYLLLENKEIRNVIDTLTSKAVLILGRFTGKRKSVLDGIKDELRKRNYLPILFDFKEPASRDLTETITTLANISRFVIADITDAKSIPQELSYIIPHLPSLAVVPIILKSQREYAMFEHFERYPWVLPLFTYASKKDLLSSLIEKVIEPAEKKVKELRK